MSNEKKDEVKRCFFCHKKILNNKDLVCKRCWLQGKDIGEKVLGVGAVVGTVALTALKVVGDINNSNLDDD